MYSVAIHDHQHNPHHLPHAPDIHTRTQPPMQSIPGPTHTHNVAPTQPNSALSVSPNPNKDPQVVIGIPSVTLSGSQLIIGDAQSTSTRVWTPLKVVGDGSFGTVWLCDWHGTLPPDTPLSPMQCGAGARAEWAGKRLVAVKRMKKKWEGGWDECQRLKELESLRAISSHPNIIPLYDSFLLPSTKELYFVFESMEGNLYQLIKSRKGRPLAGGLVSSIYSQVVNGLHHIHESGYFHRDMKPENLLVTTTGLADYPPTSPIAPPGAAPEKDVVVIIKLADFGLARETRSNPPYTEYVSTRWYRAPEVLLRSRDYSNPVDMWALGTILAELINLKPLFPGDGEIDQVARICEVLGDPNTDYGVDSRGRLLGGGIWMRGVELARNVGCSFPRMKPKNLRLFFEPSVPPSLIDCIEDLLRYNPQNRLTSKQCLNHPYLIETSRRTQHPPPPPMTVRHRPQRLAPVYTDNLPAIPPRSIPPSHSNSPHNARPAFETGSVYHELPPRQPLPEDSPSRPYYHNNGSDVTQDYSHRYPLASELAEQLREHELPDLASYGHRSPPSASSLYSFPAVAGRRLRQHTQSPEYWSMEVSPAPESRGETSPESHDSPMDVPQSPIVHSLPPDDDPPEYSLGAMEDISTPVSHNKLGKLSLGFGKRHNKWALSSVFGSHNDPSKHHASTLAPVDELNVSGSRSLHTLKRSQSGSTGENRSVPDLSTSAQAPVMDPKKLKKEQNRQARIAEKARRAELEKLHRDRARTVVQKHQRIQEHLPGQEIYWLSSLGAKPQNGTAIKGKQRAEPTLPPPIEKEEDHEDWLSHRSKARRRDLDDDHSMSSSEIHSISRMSMISFASGDSDPGPTRVVRHRPAHTVYLPRATSISSFRTSSGRGFSPSARSSNSFDRQFVRDFDERATLGMEPPLSDTGSPPPLHDLSISPTQSHWPSGERGPSPHPPGASCIQDSHYLSLPPISSLHSRQPYEHGDMAHSQDLYPIPHSTINPMFQVPSFAPSQPSPTHHPGSGRGTLPPVSHILSISDQQERSPMSFDTPGS